MDTLKSQNVLSLTQVIERTGLSRSTIYKMIKQGKFPPQVKISSRRVGWLSDVIDQWIATLSKS